MNLQEEWLLDSQHHQTPPKPGPSCPSHTKSSGDAASPCWLPKATHKIHWQCSCPRYRRKNGNISLQNPSPKVTGASSKAGARGAVTYLKWPLNKGLQHKPPPFLPAQPAPSTWTIPCLSQPGIPGMRTCRDSFSKHKSSVCDYKMTP